MHAAREQRNLITNHDTEKVFPVYNHATHTQTNYWYVPLLGVLELWFPSGPATERPPTRSVDKANDLKELGTFATFFLTSMYICVLHTILTLIHCVTPIVISLFRCLWRASEYLCFFLLRSKVWSSQAVIQRRCNTSLQCHNALTEVCCSTSELMSWRRKDGKLMKTLALGTGHTMHTKCFQ